MSEKVWNRNAATRRGGRLVKSILPLALILSFSLPAIGGSGCKQPKEEVELSIIDPLFEFPIYFRGTIDENYTVSCGSAVAGTTSSSTTTETGTGTGTTTSGSYIITSYYTFISRFVGENTGEIMSMKYTYYPDRDSYSLTPQTTTYNTCQTDDRVNCSSTGIYSCPTVDYIHCGGEEYFAYYNPLSNYSFLAETGIINWSRGFNLSDDSTSVQSIELELDFINKEGTVFQGEVSCVSNN